LALFHPKRKSSVAFGNHKDRSIVTKISEFSSTVEDPDENRRFFIGFKETLKKRFQQLDIWLTSHPIEVL
jgi:hypothetical protein